MKKKEEGITLIALIITIIVMLILVAVTINLATGGGLFDTTKKAAKDTTIQAEKERLTDIIVPLIDVKTGTVDLGKLREKLPSGWNYDAPAKKVTDDKQNIVGYLDEYGNISDKNNKITFTAQGQAIPTCTLNSTVTQVSISDVSNRNDANFNLQGDNRNYCEVSIFPIDDTNYAIVVVIGKETDAGKEETQYIYSFSELNNITIDEGTITKVPQGWSILNGTEIGQVTTLPTIENMKLGTITDTEINLANKVFGDLLIAK
jgi:hypothetical protein